MGVPEKKKSVPKKSRSSLAVLAFLTPSPSPSPRDVQWVLLTFVPRQSRAVFSSFAARVPHEQQLGTLHATRVVVALGDDVAGVGQAQTEGEQLRRALESSKP